MSHYYYRDESLLLLRCVIELNYQLWFLFSFSTRPSSSNHYSMNIHCIVVYIYTIYNVNILCTVPVYHSLYSVRDTLPMSLYIAEYIHAMQKLQYLKLKSFGFFFQLLNIIDIPHTYGVFSAWIVDYATQGLECTFAEYTMLSMHCTVYSYDIHPCHLVRHLILSTRLLYFVNKSLVWELI